MIALKLILQSLAGASAVAGLCASSTFLISTKNKEENNYVGNEHYFLLISDGSVNATAEDTEYKCTTQTKNEDESCGLFSLMFNETKKSIDFEELKDFVKKSGEETTNITKTKTEEIKGQQFFILKTNLAFAKSIKLDWTTEINLLNKSSNQNIASFTVYAKITENEALGKVNNLIGKVTSVQEKKGSNNQSNSFCKLNGSNKRVQSYMMPINNVSVNQTYKDIDFSALNDEGARQTKKTKANDYFLINFMFDGSESKSVEISSLKNNTIVCDEENVGSNKVSSSVNETISLLVEAPIFILQNKSSSKVVFLK